MKPAPAPTELPQTLAPNETEKATSAKRKRDEKLLHTLDPAEAAEYKLNMEKDAARQKQSAADARAARAQNGQKPPWKKGEKVTLALALVIFTFCCAGKGVPLDAVDVRQINHWNEQKKDANRRTILYTGINGEIKHSGAIHMMKEGGTSLDVAKTRKADGSRKKSASQLGHDQRHALEACAIDLLRAEIRKHLPAEEFAQWHFEYVFDGLEADLMARHNSFPIGKWVAIQIKSASIEFGKQTNYSLAVGKYKPWMYCIGIGVRGYVTNKHPTSCDDTHVPSARLYEMWDLGTCQALWPCPATLYTTTKAEKRCFFMHEAQGYANPSDFVRRMMRNILAWPADAMFTREAILFDRTIVNTRIKANHVIENTGFHALFKALPEMRAPARQNETVDFVWNALGFSGKTAGISNGDPKQRQFPLKAHKNDHFGNWVIVSYPDLGYMQVAVIPAAVVYRCGNAWFCWNETTRTNMQHVRIFNLETDREALRAYLLQAPNPPEPLQHQDEDAIEEVDEEEEED